MANYPVNYDPALRPAGKGALASYLRQGLDLAGTSDPRYAPLSQNAMNRNTRAYVEAHTVPFIEMLRESIEARGKAGTDAITGYTNQAVSRLGAFAPRTAAAYDEAKGDVQATRGELASFLGRAGSGTNEQLQPTVYDAEGKAAVEQASVGTAQGAAGANMAIAQGVFERLAAEGARATAFANQLPGLTALRGTDHLFNLNAQLNKELSEGTREISARAPGLAADYSERQSDRELRKADSRTQHRQFRSSQATEIMKWFMDRELQKGIGRQGFKQDAASFSQSADQWQKEFDEAQRHNKVMEAEERLRESAQEGNDKAGIRSDAAALAFGVATSLGGERDMTRYIYDPDGPKGPKQGRPVPGDFRRPVKNGKKVGTLRTTRIVGPDGQVRTKVVKPEYNQAFNQVYNRIAGELRATGLFTEQEIAQIVSEQLQAAGYKKPSNAPSATQTRGR